MTALNRLGKSKQSGYSSDQKVFQVNLQIINLIFIVVGIGLLLQMSRWQIFKKDYFTALAQSQYIDNQTQESSRGIIYAGDGTILATDQPSWNVYASLSSIESERESFFNGIDEYVAFVSGTLEIPKDELRGVLTDDFRYKLLAHNIDTDTKKALEDTKIFEDKGEGFGLYFEKSEKRIYPNGTLASHILGFIGKDEEGEDRGVYGIEGYYHGDLEGTEGFTYEEQDAFGNVILTAEYDPVLPRRGKDIKLTIIPSIQAEVEEILEKGVKNHQAKSGSVIIMDPRDGRIITIANYPNYNPNSYWKTQESWIYKDKAVSDVYEPGSVFKPLTVAIGLETGVITPETICDDSTGYFKMYEGTPDEATIYTWDKVPDGKITPEQYLQYSNNPCIAQTALAVGHEKYYPMMKQFGIGEFVGVGLHDESNSYIKPYESWIELDLAVTAFGQAVSTTPLQMISALSTIANDGKRMKPYIVSEISDDKETITFTPQVADQPLSKETANTVAKMMRSVVKKGDARWIFDKYLSDYDIAGKTGTAQIPKKDQVGYYTDRTNATFIGFAPTENPQFIMLVRLEEPGIDPYAATTAVPVWVEIFLNIADDLEIPRN